MKEPRYSTEPDVPKHFTKSFDRYYTALAGIYRIAVRLFPVWRRWLERAIPPVEGPRVLEVSFGTGYLLTQLSERFELYGIDYNRRMCVVARDELEKIDGRAGLAQGTVEALPYRDECFDSVVSTMAFSGYPSGAAALLEMKRVLRGGGKLILVDVNYPARGSWFGRAWVQFWKANGDLIRDMDPLFRGLGLDYSDEEIGGAGSIHLYVARKPKA